MNAESGDRKALECLRLHPHTIAELVDALGVTATAVRQRLDRLSAMGYVRRDEVRAGRGRPVYRYSLTAPGHRALGNNLAELAVALWSEVQALPDEGLRLQILRGVAARLAELWKRELPGMGVETRLEQLAQALRDQRMSVELEAGADGKLPVLRFHGCPYPDLSDVNHDICEVESAMLSAMLGHPLSLTSCRCDSVTGSCTYELSTAAK